LARRLARNQPAPSPRRGAPARQSDLAAAGVPLELRRYPDQGHAFIGSVDDTRVPGSDAADAWGGFADFLARRL
jgi:dienelactone hydrolase